MGNKPGIEIRKYMDEAIGLGLFMASACFFGALMEYHGLPFSQAIPSPLLRRFLVGLAMGLTALYIFTSRFGKQSGAYINPAVTLIHYRLGDIKIIDVVLYTVFQLIGGSLGVYVVYLLFPAWMRSQEVNYVITVPGKQGLVLAFLSESLISFLLISVVLLMRLKKSWVTYTPFIVSMLITLFITFEAPFSGMSMNPARTFATAIIAGEWKSFWLYCSAPVLGMLAGELLYRKVKKIKHEKNV
ncbi:MIP/aquaporin family protein [Mucilaginibacter gilvus]|uniref:Aquaporin family protein n=1 Tax=Mucilaginibacter gilvus TaxID=2305909 RepID=A0A444MNG7_9SPHI|nr:aquaporin [Mucilaginibacter gilvus]RWY51224.1 aquaporin family protein [Mucilaginibacter gilvus]